MSKPCNENRREFLRSIGRTAALGLMALGGGVLTQKTTDTSEECVNSGICRGCGEVNDCQLPQAQSYKQSKDR